MEDLAQIPPEEIPEDERPWPEIRLRQPPAPPMLEKEEAEIVAETPGYLTDLAPGEFRLEVSNPMVLRSVNAGIGRMLRFTMTWALRHERLGLLGKAEEGCLFMRLASGVYRWTPPLMRRGRKMIHNSLVFPDLYQYVLKFLTANFGGQVGPEDVRFL